MADLHGNSSMPTPPNLSPKSLESAQRPTIPSSVTFDSTVPSPPYLELPVESTEEIQPHNLSGMNKSGGEPSVAKAERSTHGRHSPLWLSKTVLGAFTVAFTLMLLATALLYHFSLNFDGLATQNPKYQLAWKYGPTAVFLMVGALWRQTDYTVKVLTPWEELEKHPDAVEETLQIDYVSALLPVSLWTALKNRHWAVALTSLGQVLIVVTTVFSTGLFVLLPTKLTHERGDFRLKSEFKLMDEIANSSEWVPGSSAAQLFYGIHIHGLRYPAGTSADIVVPEIQLPEIRFDILDYQSRTEALKIELDCQTVPVSPQDLRLVSIKEEGVEPYVAMDVHVGGCAIDRALAALPQLPDPLRNPSQPRQIYQEHFNWYTCNVETKTSPSFASYVPDEFGNAVVTKTNEDVRLLSVVTELEFSAWNPGAGIYGNITVHRATALLCNPSYYIDIFEIQAPGPSNGAAQAAPSFQGAHTRRQLDGLSNGDLGKAIWAATFSRESDGFFALMASAGGHSSLGVFLDPETLLESTTSVFNGVATQLMRQLALQPTDRSLTGSITYKELRIRVTLPATIVMCISLGLLTIITILATSFRPQPDVPAVPSSIASKAIMLSMPRFEGVLARVKPLRISRDCDLEPPQSKIAPPTRGVACLSNDQDTPFLAAPKSVSRRRFWVGKFSYFMTSLPLPAIGVLEIMQYLSNRNAGIVEVSSSTQLLSITYLPVAIAVAIAATYSGLELTAKVLMPFISLKRRKTTPGRSLDLNLVGKLSPVAAYLSYKSRHYTIITAILGSFIGGFLTIITAGLYTAVDVPQVQNISILQKDAFNLDRVKLDTPSSGVIQAASLIQFGNMDYTKWTHEDLVFHGLGELTDLDNTPGSISVTTEVPAIRPKLNCSEVWMLDPFIHDGGSKTHYVKFKSNSTFHPNDWCETPLLANKSAILSWGAYLDLAEVPTDGELVYVGKTAAMPFNEVTRYGTVEEEAPTHPSGCPSFAVTIGWLRVKNTTDKSDTGRNRNYDLDSDLRTMLCYQNYEKVTTAVTFNLPSFSIDQKQPPRPDESSVELLRDKNGSARFEFYLGPMITGLMSTRLLPKKGNKNGNSWTEPVDVDPFVKTLIISQEALSIEELAGPGKAADLHAATNRLYQTYMTQAISILMRSNTSSDGVPLGMYHGIMTRHGTRRLQQDSASKLALQVMLAIMIACAITTRLMLPLGGVLPSNPCSIARTASLLVGGSLLEKTNIGSSGELIDEPEVLLAEKFKGKLYSLKWWETSDGNLRYGIDVDDEETSGFTNSGESATDIGREV